VIDEFLLANLTSFILYPLFVIFLLPILRIFLPFSHPMASSHDEKISLLDLPSLSHGKALDHPPFS